MSDRIEKAVAGIPNPFSLSAIRKRVRLLVIDLADFTALTEQLVALDNRSGIESVSDLVTTLFGSLAERLSEHRYQVGGFCGDALIFWSSEDRLPLELSTFERLIAETLSWAGIPADFRVAHAEGLVWVGQARNEAGIVPLIWGEGVNALFTAVAGARKLAGNSGQTRPRPQLSFEKITYAAVFDRWTVIVRLCGPTQADTSLPETLETIWQGCGSRLCEFGATVENLSHDDKGLLLTIGLPGRENSTSLLDQVISALKRELTELDQPPQISAAHGTVFRTVLPLVDQNITIALGSAINRAAKTLAVSHEERVDWGTPVENLDPLVGRKIELDRLTTELETSPPSGFHRIEISGRAGVGKTRLVKAVLENLNSSGLVFRQVNLAPRTATTPFGAIALITEALGLDLSASVSWQNRLVEIASYLPHLIVIEDWHWCDFESRDLMRSLLELAPDTHFLLVTRPTQIVEHTAFSMRLSLEPLGATNVTEFLAQTLGRRPSKLEAAIVFKLSEGMPFWIKELAHELRTTNELDDLHADLAELNLDALLQRKVDRLSSLARTLWRVFATWQAVMEFSVAKDLLAQFGVNVSEQHAREIIDLGWLVKTDRDGHVCFAPAHQILADWGARDIPASFDAPLNVAIARLLTKKKADRSRIGRHWARSGAKLRAIISFELASYDASRIGAYQSCIKLLDEARTMTRDRSISNRRLRTRLAHRASAQWGLGEVTRAIRELREYDKITRPSRAIESTRRLSAELRAEFVRSETGQFAGSLPMALKGIQRGLTISSAHKMTGDLEAKARRNTMIYYFLGLLGLPVEKRFAKFASTARGAIAPRSETLILIGHATLLMSRCKWDETLPLLDRASELTEGMSDTLLAGTVLTMRASHAQLIGKGQACIDGFQALGDLIEGQRHRMFATWANYGQAQGHLLLGNYDRAYELAISARNMHHGVGDHQSSAIIEGVLALAGFHAVGSDCGIWHARRALRWNRHLAMSNYTSLDAVAAPAQVSALMAIRTGRTDALDRLGRTSRKLLARYARIFPLARPRLQYVDGLMAQKNGQHNLARKCFQRSKDRAMKVGMGYEVDLASKGLEMIKGDEF